MKKIYTLIILAVFGLSNLVQAQQFPYYYQYLLNKYSLSPAYGGVYGHTEAYLGYRHNMINVDYGPRTMMFNINTPVAKKSGIGLVVINDKADIFNNLYVLGSYAYHLQVAKDHYIDFALSGGINQKKIDFSGALGNPLIDPYDPIFQGKTNINELSLELGGGLMYRWKAFNIGVSVPSFYEVNSNIYKFQIHYIPYVSYDFKIDTNWNIEPSLVLRTVKGAPVNFDVSAFVRFKEKIWFGPTYRANNIGALSIGGEVAKNLVFLYTYDFAIPFSTYKGVIGGNYGGHEITIGYRFGPRPGAPPVKEENYKAELAQKARASQVDSLAKLAEQLNQLVQRLADSLDNLKRQSISTDISNLEEQVRKLNEKIIAMTGVDKDITKIAQTVYFEFDKDILVQFSKDKLNELVDILRKYPTFKLTIAGHCDYIGTLEYNQVLSEKRAAAVVEYLVSKGIDRSRMSSAGYGKTRPIDTNETDAGRAKNRRTEITAY